MSLTVFLLDYQRFQNILHGILPALLQDSCVNQIIVCHGSFDYTKVHHEKFSRLEPNEIQLFEWEGKQIIRIQDPFNDQYQCFRRWIWIDRLFKQGLLINHLVLTHDDDFVFFQGETCKLLDLWAQQKGVCVCGSGGRMFREPSKYILRAVNGPCNIAVGQSMLLSVASVVQVCAEVEKMAIPLEILHEDDIVVSLLLGKGENVHYGYSCQKYSLPSPNARWHRPDHILRRNESAEWILTRLPVSSSTPNCPLHLHSPSTTDDRLLTSESIAPLSYFH
jgi:hypothetical protein